MPPPCALCNIKINRRQPDMHYQSHGFLFTANQGIMLRSRTICACSAMTCAFCSAGSSSICSGVRLMICASSAATQRTQSSITDAHGPMRRGCGRFPPTPLALHHAAAAAQQQRSSSSSSSSSHSNETNPQDMQRHTPFCCSGSGAGCPGAAACACGCCCWGCCGTDACGGGE